MKLNRPRINSSVMIVDLGTAKIYNLADHKTKFLLLALMNRISETDLILNPDGSVYHLELLPGDIADTVITVGDQDRVAAISKYFDHIEVKKTKREFVTHTGYVGNQRLTVLSTGIGTDNIDIVLNELDALVNIDLKERTVNPQLKSLNIIRIGTTGAVQPDLEVDSMLVSSAAIGLDTLMHFYQDALPESDRSFFEAFVASLPKEGKLSPYMASANDHLVELLAGDLQQGVTLTAPGFYAPQGRQVRAVSMMDNMLDVIKKFSFAGRRITNIEMETAGIYGLASALGHKAISFNVILANRITYKFSVHPNETMEKCIIQLLEKLSLLV